MTILRHDHEHVASLILGWPADLERFGTVRHDRQVYIARRNGTPIAVLKVFTRGDPRYANERTVYEALGGRLAPALLGADDQHAVIATAFVRGRTLASTPPTLGMPVLATAMGALLDALAPLPITYQGDSHASHLDRYWHVVHNAPGAPPPILAREDCEVELAALPKALTHRDLQPSNILIEPDGTVRIVDYEFVGYDAPLIDCMRLFLNPTLRLQVSARLAALEMVVARLQLMPGQLQDETRRALVAAGLYWATCCSGYYRVAHPRESGVGGRYHEICAAPLEIVRAVFDG